MRKAEMSDILMNHSKFRSSAINHVLKDLESRKGDKELYEDFKAFVKEKQRDVSNSLIPSSSLSEFALSDFYNDKYNPPPFTKHKISNGKRKDS